MIPSTWIVSESPGGAFVPVEQIRKHPEQRPGTAAHPAQQECSLESASRGAPPNGGDTKTRPCLSGMRSRWFLPVQPMERHESCIGAHQSMHMLNLPAFVAVGNIVILSGHVLISIQINFSDRLIVAI